METQLTTKTHSPHWGTYVTLIALLVGTVGLVILQVATANTATKTESALYSVLQFIFSLAFAWILTKVVTEQQFIESQRKFAIGAFRRIREIERSLNRTQRYVTNAEASSERSAVSDLAVIRAGLLNAQDAVRSSIADWADIIGDEIEVTNEIRRLKQLKSETDDGVQDGEVNRPDEKRSPRAMEVTTLEDRIEKLASALPAEIRADLDEEEDEEELALDYLGDLWKQNRFLELTAFWEPGDSFAGSVDEIDAGTSLYIARGLTEHRNGVFLVYDANGKWIGVVTNECAELGCDYDGFVRALEKFYDRPLLPKSFGGIPLAATVIDIENFNATTERRYFRLRISTLPEHPCIEGITEDEESTE